jgi:cell division protein FtsL
MNKRAVYDKEKEDAIHELIKQVSTTTDLHNKYELYHKIYEEYQFYSFNKALQYIEENIRVSELLGNNLYLNKTKLELGLLLLDSGRYKESIDALNEIKRDSLSESLINEYYIAYKEGYSGLSYNTTVQRSKSVYSKLYTAYRDSLYVRLDPNSEPALRLKEKEYRDSRDIAIAFRINTQRLNKVTMGSRGYSLITFERSLLHEINNNTAKQKEYLIKSAISDIEASVKDNASMGTLAKILFAEGDIDRAHEYINFSFDDAVFYNSQLRFVNIANSLPMITKAYEERNELQKNRLEKSLIFISILAGFLLIAIYLVFKQVRKVSVARNKLSSANEKLNELNTKLNINNEDLKKLYLELSQVDKVKEHYIGTFLNLYSEYIDKLDVYRKLVRKYVQANQMKPLLELSKSKQFIEEELDIFNKNFDRSFLHIYPNFVKEVNELLQPEKQVLLKSATTLNTELRILALIKLGITNSSRIAKILRYSVNTIYNYRAAIKSASKDKTSFEEMIKNIQ